MKGREILLYFSQKYAGDFDKIYHAIETKERVTQEQIEEVTKNFKGNYFTIIDDDYPDVFKTIYRPPLVVYYHGDINLLSDLSKAIAVIGSRKASKTGLKITETIVSDLVKEDFTIVSGLAAGIDGCAHEVALNNEGKTIAVLGSGIDRPYPARNKELYLDIINKGLVLSEYPGETTPSREYFPERNRIVAALTKGVLVVESKIRSGTLITVNYALNKGSDIFCVPWRATDNSGGNRLIRDGAYLVESAKDIIDIWKNSND
ncbi:MAG: DNA-processing protein DprA [Bacilli bacterium]